MYKVHFKQGTFKVWRSRSVSGALPFSKYISAIFLLYKLVIQKIAITSEKCNPPQKKKLRRDYMLLRVLWKWRVFPK